MLEFGTENKEITEDCPNAPFVVSVNDNGDNELRILIALPQRKKDKEPIYDNNPKINDLLRGSYPVCKDTNRVYEILFKNYIIYQCRNESYTTWNNREIRKGKYLIIYEKSALLDYYKNVIFDFDLSDKINSRKHYGIDTENHVIDVISNDPPVITAIKK